MKIVPKKILSISEPHLLEEKLANIISDGIEPKIIPEIEIAPYRSAYLLAVGVYPSTSRPHYLKKAGEEKGTYIRVGSTNRLADKVMITELKRLVSSESFDEQPFPKSSSEDIDFRVASELFSEVCKLKLRDLETLNIITKYQGHLVPTMRKKQNYINERCERKRNKAYT